MKKLDILITGSSGYIGLNLMDAVKDEHNVFGYDVEDNPAYTITNLDSLLAEMKGKDIVFHCAAMSDVKACSKNKMRAYDINVEGTKKVMLSAKYCKTIPVLFSSEAVFGDSYYGRLKAIIEDLYADQAVIFRLANVYGGNYFLEKKNTVVAHFLTDDVLTVHGDGSQTRSFIHVSKVIQQCKMVVENVKYFKNPPPPSENINVDAPSKYGIYPITGKPITIRSLAYAISLIRDIPILFKSEE